MESRLRRISLGIKVYLIWEERNNQEKDHNKLNFDEDLGLVYGICPHVGSFRGCLVLALLVICSLGACSLFVGDAFCCVLLRVEPGMDEEGLRVWEFGQRSSTFPLFRLQYSVDPCVLSAGFVSILQESFIFWLPGVIFSVSVANWERLLGAGFAGCSWLGGCHLFVGDAFCWALLRVEPGMDELACCLGEIACLGVWAAFFCFPPFSVAAVVDHCVLVWVCVLHESFIFWLSSVIFSVSVANWELSRVPLSLYHLLPRSTCFCTLLAEILSLPSLVSACGLCQRLLGAGFAGCSWLRGCPLFVGDAFCWVLLRVEAGMDELACCLVLIGSSFSCSLTAEFELFSSQPSSAGRACVCGSLGSVLLCLAGVSSCGCEVSSSRFRHVGYDKGCLVVALLVVAHLGAVLCSWVMLFAGLCCVWSQEWRSSLAAWSCMGPPTSALWRLSLNFSLPIRLLQGRLACVGVWTAFFCFPPLSVATVVDLCVLVWESFIFWLSSVIFSVSVANWELSRVPLSLYLLRLLGASFAGCSCLGSCPLFVGDVFCWALLRVEPGMDERACCLVLRGSSFSCSLAAEFDFFSYQPSSVGRACVCGSLGSVLLLSSSFGVLQEYFILWLTGVIFSSSFFSFRHVGSVRGCLVLALLVVAGLGCYPLFVGDTFCWALLRVEPGMDELACCLGGLACVGVWATFFCFPPHSVATVVDLCVLVWVSCKSLSSSGCQVSSSRFRHVGSVRGCLVLALLVVAGLGAVICSWVMLFAGLCCVWSLGWMSWLAAWSCVGPPTLALWWLSLNFSLPSRLLEGGLACVGVWAAFFYFPPLSVAAIVDPCVLVWVCVLQESYILWLSGVIFSVSVANWELSRRLLGAGFAGCSWLGGCPLFVGDAFSRLCCVWSQGWMSWLAAWSCVGPLSPAFWRLSLNFSPPNRFLQGGLTCVGVWAAFFCFPPLSVAVVVDPFVLVWVSCRNLSSSGCQVLSSRLVWQIRRGPSFPLLFAASPPLFLPLVGSFSSWAAVVGFSLLGLLW
ncbi:hypothetical protein OIU78_028533 [Salix suchowensis]|nr:hypothetical protein OIU78_028533 [Salix suchowensis]